MKHEPTYVPLEKATTPRDGECLTDRWWSHQPGRGLIFYGPRGHLSPQCNHDRAVAEDLTAKLWPGAEVIHVPVVFVGHRRRD